jgi:hypothetical protein
MVLMFQKNWDRFNNSVRDYILMKGQLETQCSRCGKTFKYYVLQQHVDEGSPPKLCEICRMQEDGKVTQNSENI